MLKIECFPFLKKETNKQINKQTNKQKETNKMYLKTQFSKKL